MLIISNQCQKRFFVPKASWKTFGYVLNGIVSLRVFLGKKFGRIQTMTQLYAFWL